MYELHVSEQRLWSSQAGSGHHGEGGGWEDSSRSQWGHEGPKWYCLSALSTAILEATGHAKLYNTVTQDMENRGDHTCQIGTKRKAEALASEHKHFTLQI